MQNNILDNPVWSALTTIHTKLSIGSDCAKRFRPDISPLAGVLVQSSEYFTGLATLCCSGDELNILQAMAPALPPEFEIVNSGIVWQLVKTHKGFLDHPDIQVVELGYEHRLQMLELATLTKPGPFSENSYLFGGFLGLFEDKRLISMAGERLRQPGFAEVSGVCTHPDFQGRGLA